MAARRQSRASRSRSPGSTRSKAPNIATRKRPPADRKLIAFNKPFDVLCQFTDDGGRTTLAHYINIPDVYVAGRLDRDSEGLLLLTNDGALQHNISHPARKLAKTYLVQVDGVITPDALLALSRGVELKDGMTAPARASAANEPDGLWPRTPPIRYRANLPTSWLQLTLTEGRNRQVRRMTAAVGFPTLRLIRTAIGGIDVWSLSSGSHRECQVDELTLHGSNSN